MEQNSQEWIEYRKSGIGSSDAPIIMGVSPYMTAYQLWQEKLNLKKFNQSNQATYLGQYFEKYALEQFNKEQNLNCFPAIKEHPEFNWIRASLDGDDPINRCFVEIKYMGKNNFNLVKESQQPLNHHVPQVQHQFLVTGYERGFYCAYTLNSDKNEIDELIVINLKRDNEFINEKLFLEIKNFWNFVSDQIAPPLSDKDQIVINDQELVGLSDRLNYLNVQIDVAEKERDKIKEKLSVLTETHPRVVCGSFLIQKQVRKGLVKYQDIPELKTVDLNKYRGLPSEFVVFKKNKNYEPPTEF